MGYSQLYNPSKVDKPNTKSPVGNGNKNKSKGKGNSGNLPYLKMRRRFRKELCR